MMSSRKRKTSILSAANEVEDDYLLKRQRNNDAVNRTRQRKRQEENDTSQKVEQLRAENAQLERRVESLQSEMNFLKEMFMNFAKKNEEKDKVKAKKNAKS